MTATRGTAAPSQRCLAGPWQPREEAQRWAGRGRGTETSPCFRALDRATGKEGLLLAEQGRSSRSHAGREAQRDEDTPGQPNAIRLPPRSPWKLRGPDPRDGHQSEHPDTREAGFTFALRCLPRGWQLLRWNQGCPWEGGHGGSPGGPHKGTTIPGRGKGGVVFRSPTRVL